jgi:hypothetical protein
MMENSNSGENNSGENSVDVSDSSNKANTTGNAKISATAGHPSNPTDPHHHHHHHHQYHRDVGTKPRANSPLDHETDEAVREKKIQDKKRKRMNMRREYEEKVEQEMDSSETSRDRDVVIRPGKPVTLDKVLSFTKTPRLVVKAGPPFLVVYTNAAYCRLSGIDSHNAVGKPITILLDIPSHDEAPQINFLKGRPALEDAPVNAAKSAENEMKDGDDKIGSPQNNLGANGTESHVAAEAAGRARAEASKEDNTELGLERLIAASGFGRVHMIYVRAKPHHMVGRNVKVLQSSVTPKRSQEEGSNGSSISSSYEGPYHFVACTMTISPVVSSPEAYSVAAVVTDKEKGGDHQHHKSKRSDKDQESCHQHKAKRRKHHHHHQHGDNLLQHHPHRQDHSFDQKRQLISHYVIQLEAIDGDSRKIGTMASQSSASTAVEANMLGMTKTEVRQQRMRALALQQKAALEGNEQDGQNGEQEGDDDDDEEMESEEISESRQHVSAIG